MTSQQVEVIGGRTADSTIISFASTELKEYLGKIFPAELLQKITCTLELAPDGIQHDGFHIAVTAMGIHITACYERGLLHGVYYLLRKLGCSFLFPGSAREQVPRLQRWPFTEDWAAYEEPWLEYRGLCLFHLTKETLGQIRDAVDWMAKNGFNFLLTSIHRLDDTGCGDHAILWDEIGQELLPEVQKRGIVLDMSEHSTGYYFPKEELFTLHPDWFALVEGKRQPGQICYSSTEAVEAYGDSLAAFARDKPWFQFFGIWPLDGGGYCECEKCRDPRTVFKASAVIAAKLKKVRPDLVVEHLAYTPQSFARPEHKMPDNMSVLVCGKRDFIAYEWALAARNAGGAFYFDYMTADHYRSRSNVWLSPIYCHETVNALAGYGFRGAVSLYLPVDCWWQAGINFRYLSRLYYHPEVQLEQLHAELAAELFGHNCAEKGAALLEFLCSHLLNPTLWTGFPHAHEWYCEHISGRNRALDALHGIQFDAAAQELLRMLDEIASMTQGKGLENAERMRQFVELQCLYFHCIDQYDAETDTPARAEPYFRKLAELQKLADSPFISEEYARWRITGRDNVFDADQENLFQARA